MKMPKPVTDQEVIDLAHAMNSEVHFVHEYNLASHLHLPYGPDLRVRLELVFVVLLQDYGLRANNRYYEKVLEVLAYALVRSEQQQARIAELEAENVRLQAGYGVDLSASTEQSIATIYHKGRTE